MGGSSWNDDFYRDRDAHRKATGTPTFKHDDDIRTGKAAPKAHDKLNPKGVTREARDSDAHPDSVPVAVFFDNTGSMGTVPRVLQTKLPQLMGILLRKGFIKDPQILFGAINDFFAGSTAPLQVGQFESGIEMDDDLTNLYLEGGGGGQDMESYEAALYFMAKHVVTDAWEKRRRKGYLFIIGDEKPFPNLTRSECSTIFGDDIEADIPIKKLVEQVDERFHIFYLFPKGSTYWSDPHTYEYWKTLINAERCIKVEDPANVCETIGGIIGLIEGTADPTALDKDLVDAGVVAATAKAVYASLDPLAKSALVKVGTGNLPEKKERSSAVERL